MSDIATPDDDDFQQDLECAAEGDEAARQRLWSKHYETLRACARAWFDNQWAGRGDGFRVSIGGTHIVIDHYRKTKNDKGRGEHRRVPLDCQGLADQGLAADPGVIYDILAELERRDGKSGQIAMMKIFESVPDEDRPGVYRGLRNEEVADKLGYSLSLVEKRWKFAKAYLQERLGQG